MARQRLIGKQTAIKQKQLVLRLSSVLERKGEMDDAILLRGLAGLLRTISDCEVSDVITFTISE